MQSTKNTNNSEHSIYLQISKFKHRIKKHITVTSYSRLLSISRNTSENMESFLGTSVLEQQIFEVFELFQTQLFPLKPTSLVRFLILVIVLIGPFLPKRSCDCS